MKIKIITISSRNESSSMILYQKYISRLKHYCTLESIDIKSTSQKEESMAVLKKINSNEELILLDEGGKQFSSKNFSEWLQKKMNASGNLCFVVGSAYGFDPSLEQKCAQKISLSQMTFPHQLAKVIFAEQLYRAFTIIKNEKYHH